MQGGGSERVVVGETGDETVTRTGLRSGTVKREKVTSMKTLTNLGMHEPEMLNVVPVSGYYAQRFKERMNRGAGIMGGIGKSIKGMFATGTGGGDTGMINGDKNSLEMGSYTGGTYKTVTGYTVPNYIQSPGHGATNSAKWTNPNMNPNSWKAVPMVDDPSKWKVVDDKGINIAAGFVEEDQANEFIQEHIFTAHGGGIEGDEGGGGTGGGGTGGGGGTPTSYTPTPNIQL